jgi:hypothetical protein
MTDREISDLVILSKSWNNSPDISRVDNTKLEYDKSQRAYIENRSVIDKLNYRVNSSKENPLVDLALVVTDWNANEVDVSIDGKKLNRNKFRSGVVDNGKNQSLILWIEHNSQKEFDLEILAR